MPSGTGGGDTERLDRGSFGVGGDAGAELEVDALQPRLVERSGPNVGREHPLGPGVHVVGRDPLATLTVQGPDVSRRHAQIEVEADAVRIADLGSKNGVEVDGEPLSGARTVVDGARITLGGLELELVHPAARVDRALRGAGELTMTRRRPIDGGAVPRRSLLVPVLGMVVFGGGALVLWWMS